MSVSIINDRRDNVCETITKTFTQIADNFSLVFIIFINLFGQLRDWVGQVLFLVSCSKGQVKKNDNVEACIEWVSVV
jgi:hypothetical protein